MTMVKLSARIYTLEELDRNPFQHGTFWCLYLCLGLSLCCGRMKNRVSIQYTLLARLQQLVPTALRTPMLSTLGVNMSKRCYPS